MKMQFLPDQPINSTLQDQLNLKRFASRIWDSIQRTNPPFSFGILGDWGTGKTSVLHILEDLIHKQSPSNDDYYFVPIWFNPWLYENETNIIYPLLHAIKREYTDRVGVSEKTRSFFDTFKKIAYVSTMAITDITLRSISNHLMGDALSLDDLVNRVKEFEEKSNSLGELLDSWADQVTKFRDAFANLLDMFANDLSNVSLFREIKVYKDKIRFVILIDDLDRCLPQTTIDILEAIKNFLSNEKCVYVLALNHKVIYQGISIKYQGISINGRQYLEKILNYSFYVPQPTEDDIERFVINSLKNLTTGTLDVPTQRAFEKIGVTVRECSFDNPRKIKRVLNHFLVYLSVFSFERVEMSLANVARLIILGEYYPDIFLLIAKDPSKLKQELMGIGTAQFSIKNFENTFGVSISGRYSELVHLKKLFNIVFDPGSAYSVELQIKDVQEILNVQGG